MNTNDKKNQNNLEEFRTLIAVHALKRRANGATIVAKNDESGQTDEWMFDFRAVMLNPEWINMYAEIFWDRYAAKYPFQVGGMETGGIPLVTAIVMKGIERGTPVSGFYIRKSRKRDGLMKIVEGTLTDDPIILVDDLVNSGQTLLKEVVTLRDAGKSVRDVFVVVSFRDTEAFGALTEHTVSIQSLFLPEDFNLSRPRTNTQAPAHDSFTEVWRYTSRTPSHFLVVAKSSPALDDVRIYMGFDDGVFRAFDKNTGALAWECKIGGHPRGKGILSSPALVNGHVYFGAYDGTVYALDAATGKKVWQYDDADWVGSSPCIDTKSRRLYIGLEFGLFKKRGGVAALDAATGKRIWTWRSREMTHASPLCIPEEKIIVCGSNDGIVTALDIDTGSVQWQFPTRGDIKSAGAYDVKRRQIIVNSMDGNCYVLSAHDGLPRHAIETSASIYGSPLVIDDTVYIASLDKTLYAINLESGKVRWTHETRGRIFSSPTYGLGSLWVGSNDGLVYELDPHHGTVRGTFQTPEKIVNKIVCDEASNLIYVSTHAGELYCLKREAK